MTIAILFFILIIIILESYIFTIKTPIFCIVIWWLSFLFLANINSNINISFKTNTFFMLNFIFFYCSSLIFRKKLRINNNDNNVTFKMFFKVEKFKYIVALINIISLFLIFNYLHKNSIALKNYRDLLFIDDELLIKILGYTFRKLLFISSLFTLFYYSKGVINYTRGRKKDFIFYFINLIVLDTINGSRSYSIMAVLIFISTLYFLKKDMKKIIKFSFIGLSIGIILSYLRMKNLGILGILKTNLLYYHIVPFALFNQDYMNPSSFLYTNQGKGMAILGLILISITNQFGIKTPVEFQNKLTDYMMTFKNIGCNKPFYYNAFYTIFYNLYIDGGLIFSLIAVIFYSYCISKSWINFEYNKTISNYLSLYICLIIGFASIYFSITYTYYWLLLVLFIILRIYQSVLKTLNFMT